MTNVIRLLAVLIGSMSLVSCNVKHSPVVTPQNHPGFHLGDRRADSSFQASTFDFMLSRSYYYRNPSTQQPFSQTTKIVSAIFYAKVFEHQQKLGWCGGFAVADDDPCDLQFVGQKAGHFTSYLEVGDPGSQPKSRIWTGPFLRNKSNRLENVMTRCAVTDHPWLPAYETARLSVHLDMDLDLRAPNPAPQGGSKL